MRHAETKGVILFWADWTIFELETSDRPRLAIYLGGLKALLSWKTEETNCIYLDSS